MRTLAAEEYWAQEFLLNDDLNSICTHNAVSHDE